MLALVASLATTSLVNLRDAVTRLDQTNLHLLIDAVSHADGTS